MNFIAIKMLVGDRAKYLGILMGLTFASLLITQQSGIFVGLMSRTFGFLTDTSLADIWVMDPEVDYVDDIKPLRDTDLYRVRSIAGVQWAVPLYKGLLQARLDNGDFQTCNVIGLDDATLIGGPPIMVKGSLEDLRRSDGVIVDDVGAADKLAKTLPNGRRVPLQIGDTLELNDNRAVVVGICRTTRTFQSQPMIYTTYSRATIFAPFQRKMLSFILVKAQPGENLQSLCYRIHNNTGLAAHTRAQFVEVTLNYFMKNTGIPINFGMSVLLGLIIGTAIAGQTFYNFTLDNLRYFGTLKAMGASNGSLLGMIVLQALTVGLIGYGLGVGAACLFGAASSHSELAFRLPWQVLALGATAELLICVGAALLSIWKVVRLEPAIVFRS
jgi:putative ABC transport system permease protein